MPELHDLMKENEAYFHPENENDFANVVITANNKIVHLVYRSPAYISSVAAPYRLRIWTYKEDTYSRTYYEFLEENHREEYLGGTVTDFKSWDDVDTDELTQLQELVPNIHEIVQQALLTFMINNV